MPYPNHGKGSQLISIVSNPEKISEVNNGWFIHYSEGNNAWRKVNPETPVHANGLKTQQNFQVFFTVFLDKNKLPYNYRTSIK